MEMNFIVIDKVLKSLLTGLPGIDITPNLILWGAHCTHFQSRNPPPQLPVVWKISGDILYVVLNDYKKAHKSKISQTSMDMIIIFQSYFLEVLCNYFLHVLFNFSGFL